MSEKYDFVRADKDEVHELRDHFLAHARRFILSPRQWEACPEYSDLKWTIEAFSEEDRDNVPDDEQGIYTFVIYPGVAGHPACAYLVYVGKTERQGFRKRYAQYLAASLSRPRLYDVLRKWKGYIKFCYAPVSDPGEIGSIEDALIAAFLPPCNSMFPGTVRASVKMFEGY